MELLAGTNLGVDWNDTFGAAYLYKNPELVALLRKKFAKGAYVELHSCQSGDNPDDLQLMANLLGVRVWGVIGPCYIGNLNSGKWTYADPDDTSNPELYKRISPPGAK